MNTDVKACVLSAHNGKGWYAKGQHRLVNSLRHHGFSHDIVALTCTASEGGWKISGSINGVAIEPMYTSVYKSDCVYTLKAAAFEYAQNAGYDVILWLDCSVFPIKPIEPLFDVINTDGYYLWRSGFSIGQTCSQHCLDWFNISRERAFDINDTSTSMMGVKLSNPLGAQLMRDWLNGAKAGMFHGSRAAIVGAEGRQQLFEHRQDQSVCSCVAAKMGLKLHDPGIYSQYATDEGVYPESVMLVMRGM